MATQSIMQPNPQGRLGSWQEALRTPWVIGLGALLAAQLLLAIALTVGGGGSLDPTRLDQPLLGIDPAQVTSIRIEGGDGKAVELTKTDDVWVLSGAGDFPADGPRVDRFLEQLATLERPLPVATSPEALERHKVADDAFERRVTLGAGNETLATLILGDSPGFRRLFARPADESVVYDIDLALFDASDRRDDWIVRDALRVPEESIEGVSAADWSLVKGESGWQLDGSDTPPDQEAVDGLLSRLSGLGYRGVLGTEARPEYGQDQPTLELTLRLADGGSRTYRVSKVQDSDDLILKASDKPWYFKLSDYDIEGIADLDRARLLGETKETTPAAAAEVPDPADAAPPAEAETPAPAASEDQTAPPQAEQEPAGATNGSEQVEPAASAEAEASTTPAEVKAAPADDDPEPVPAAVSPRQ